MVLRAVTRSGLTGLLVAGCLGIASEIAKADTFDVNAVVGNENTGGPGVPGIYTGLTLTGTLDIDTSGLGNVDSGTITVEGDPNIFTNFFGCPSLGTCTYTFNNGFDEFGLLDLGNPAGYTGGSLLPDSYIALTDPLGSGNGEVQYLLSGTVTLAPTPEPRFYFVFVVGVCGLLFARRRRHQSA